MQPIKLNQIKKQTKEFKSKIKKDLEAKAVPIARLKKETDKDTDDSNKIVKKNRETTLKTNRNTFNW